MKGVTQFVKKNFKSPDLTFENCLHAIIYAFKLLEKDKTYSRKKILSETTRVRGKIAKMIELEDYLRNDLVKNFIEPNLKDFYLQNYLFIPGADELSDNIRTGILDIKVCSPSFNGDVYYIFECKRYNKSLTKGYLNDGVKRFVTSQYYPDSNTPVAGMISFLESTELKNKINIQDAFTELNSGLNASKDELGLIGKLNMHKLNCKKYNVVTDYEYIFKSKHKRSKLKINIELFHIMLDYNDLITD
jgi:hypothetical protein